MGNNRHGKMKKIVCLLTLSLFAFAAHTQQIERLSDAEIKGYKTPKSVAYNFVMSIINERYTKMQLLMTLDYRDELKEEMGEKTFQTYFSRGNLHDIVDMRPVVKMGYDVVITGCYEINTDNYFERQGKFNPYKGLPALSISFDCADSNNNLYDDSKGRYDTDTKVLVVKIGDEWNVFGFK